MERQQEKGEEEEREGKLSVWVSREEKVVVGLSKRTTCADVVRVLLEDGDLAGGPASYCIVERWRGFERVLPRNTRILRLRAAWAEERESVRFVLARSGASLAEPGPRSAEARLVPSKQSPVQAEPRAPGGLLPSDKRRRMVWKAFRKLDKINRARERATRGDDRMESLVHLVISQDRTIRRQVRRISELDAEIERCEAKVHRDRMEKHGVNYVHHTYLQAGDAEGSGVCGDSGAPQEELRDEGALQREELRLHAAGLRIEEELRVVRGDLERTREACSVREREMRDLLKMVNTLRVEEDACGDSVERLAGSHSVDDDDSDTGLSSPHTHRLCESQV